MTPTPRFDCLATGLDVQPIIDRIESMPELWAEITARQEYTGSAHKDTECIYARGPYSFTPYYYLYDLGSYDYPAMDKLGDVLIPVLRPLLTDVLCVAELGRVLIVNLKAGGKIKPHIDQGKYADHFARFHVALTSNDHCMLEVAGDQAAMKPGEAWWFDHKQQHSAFNLGATDRWHIILDAVSPLFPVGKVPVSIHPATTVASSGVTP